MNFSEIYDPTFPPDTQASNQLGLDIRNFKTDIAQRIASLSGITVASAEALGFETVFYGAPFIDAATGRVYTVGATFTELTQFLGASLFTETASTSAMQAALVLAIESLVAPNALTLPALTALQSPQISNGPGSDLAVLTNTITQAAGILTPTQLANTGYVQAAQAAAVPLVTFGSNSILIKIPLTYNTSGVAVTFVSICGVGNSGDTVDIAFPVTYLAAPFVALGNQNGSNNISTGPTTGGLTLATTTACFVIAIGTSD